jgi:tripartite-type tricarboxylate transporter receptor subunit TctC
MTHFSSRVSAGRALGLLLGATLASGFGVPALAADVADFYKGKNISLVIGLPPGGGYDAYARALADHMGRHIPGKPALVPRNMPGASSLLAANFIYNSAPRDGTVFGAYSAGAVFAPLMGNKKAQFETSKFTWIGNGEKSTGTCAVWQTSKIRTMNDVLSKPSIFGASGATGVMSEFPRAMNALIGARAQVIHGYAGGTGVLLAMQRGEVDGSCAMALSTLQSVRHDDWKSGRLVVLVQNGFEPEPALKGVPHIYDFARSEDDRKAMELVFGRQALGRPYAGPPGLPADRTAALRTAFMATMKDPAFLNDAKKRGLDIDPMTGEQVEKLIQRFYSYPDAIVQRARDSLAIGKVAKVKLKTAEGTIARVSKKRMTLKDGSGQSLAVKLHRKRTKVSVAGAKADLAALKAGMSCKMQYFGAGDLAPKVDCK